ncbi:MAG: YHS domain-containing protein [Candidatus Omnitrophica bacterium]|nr:YHS domain-containing protein [Candidatus Omnitrophota bacterium]
MKKSIYLSLVIGFIMALSFTVLAQAQESAVVKGQAVQVGNKICPVSGEKVDANSGMGAVTYEYKGKVYNLCCQGCVSMFQQDPDKYSAIADQEVAAHKDQMKDMPMANMPMGHKM